MLAPISPEWKAEFSLRRWQVLAKMATHSMMFIPGALIHQRNSDTEYPFRQNSDFFYLTGFKEPSAALILLKGEAHDTKSILFLEPKNKEEETWVGEKLGVEAAPDYLGLDLAFPIQELDNRAIDYILEHPVLYLSLGIENHWDRRMNMIWIKKARQRKRRQKSVYDALYDAQSILHEQRLFKTELELDFIRKAANLSATAHQELMQSTKPGMYEFELAAKFAYKANLQGCELAYPSIVAAGSNACTLHYTRNNSLLQAQDLLLVDAGIEYEYYASDITRTYPIGKKFSGPQRDLYQLVLSAQEAAIAAIRPGLQWSDIQKSIVSILVQGLVDLKILNASENSKTSIDGLIETRAYSPYYMHSSGHWLGLDVHDAGAYEVQGESRYLQANMALTVEPGLYMDPNIPNLAPEFQGIGIRIEDDILVTPQGSEVLSANIVKSIADVEALRA
ncbi:MAG: aminopeptidase P N-terminal domain-containing protein [Gammaproteobacteria bacterium]